MTDTLESDAIDIEGEGEETAEFDAMPSVFDALVGDEGEEEGADEGGEEEAPNGADLDGIPEDAGELRSLVATQRSEIDRLAKAQQGTYEDLKKERTLNTQRIQKLEELLTRAATPAEEPEEEVELPDPDIDPQGYTVAMVEAQAKKIDSLMEELKTEKTEANRSALANSVEDWIASSEAVALQADPTYEQASEHWDSVVTAQLEMVGGDPNDADAVIKHLTVAELQLAQVAKARGTTVADLKVKQAKMWGWVAKPIEAAEGAEEEASEEPEKKETVADKRKANKAKRSRSLDTLLGGASKGGPKPNLKKILADANQDEFNAMIDHLKEQTGIQDEDKLDQMIEEGKL